MSASIVLRRHPRLEIETAGVCPLNSIANIVGDPDRLVSHKLLLSIEEASNILSIGRSHLYEYIQRGELRSCKLGKSRRIPSAALIEFVNNLTSDCSE